MIFFFFFNDTATTEIYTLSLHDALPISPRVTLPRTSSSKRNAVCGTTATTSARSEEHTSELQSQSNLVCRLLLEKKKNNQIHPTEDKPQKHTKTSLPTKCNTASLTDT